MTQIRAEEFNYSFLIVPPGTLLAAISEITLLYRYIND